MIDSKEYEPAQVNKEEWSHAKCDKYDYMIAAFCGGAAGLIDVFFVGDPISSALGKSVDDVADRFVMKAAHFFWKHDGRINGRSKNMPMSLEQCVSYLEQAFPVKYDARYAKDLIVEEGVLSGMRPVNHHLLSLAHSPDVIGLIFSIIDQFMGYATFVDQGHIIQVIPKRTSSAIPYMQGSNLPSMLFCGFANWIGHLISDLVGSSSTRKVSKTGRGAGIPIPFYELFLSCDFGDIEGKTFAETMIKVFENGYDFRFGMTMAVPVVIEELMIKSIWMIRQKFLRKKSWKESFPTKQHADLRIMLIVGNGTLCIVDGMDAIGHSIIEENIVSFILHLNLIGWVRFMMLIFRELRFRYGPALDRAIKDFFENVMAELRTSAEKQRVQEFYDRVKEYDQYLDMLFKEFMLQIEIEYKELYSEIEQTFCEKNEVSVQAEHSVRLAEISRVSEDKIVRNHDDLDNMFF